ncbi:MAG TPA: endonuclease VII domain-containing protein [Acidimicrobiales bacterium]|nr:endonuclease VII domain-containing protein [Acidimicrobiales bacterium]
MKRCRICNEVKPLDAFYAMKGMRDGHRSECKACNLSRRKAAYAANPEPTIERAKAWRRANPERAAETQRNYRSQFDYAGSMRASHLRRKFGITQEQYERRLREQGGGCAVCKRPPKPGKSLHVDHDHETGRVRGLLCFRRNAALGQLDDDLERIEAALTYVATKRRVEQLRAMR